MCSLRQNTNVRRSAWHELSARSNIKIVVMLWFAMQFKKNYLWQTWVNHQNLFKAKAGPKAMNVKKILKYWVEQLAILLKNFKGNLHNKALGHYREMAWLPFQKILPRINESNWYLQLCDSATLCKKPPIISTASHGIGPKMLWVH